MDTSTEILASTIQQEIGHYFFEESTALKVVALYKTLTTLWHMPHNDAVDVIRTMAEIMGEDRENPYELRLR
jgi:hypothetical protein